MLHYSSIEVALNRGGSNVKFNRYGYKTKMQGHIPKINVP